MWLFLVTEIMFFGGMFCAYLIYRLRTSTPSPPAASSSASGWERSTLPS
jgi:heme/copper-type cytochrome/quinol oxidase subunit 3